MEADAAVSYGKQHGCNQYVPFAREMLRDAAAETAFETSLKEAIHGADITNFYQPIFCTRSHQIVGFEALARWTRAGAVIATPDRFIPVAEDTWMIVDMGRRLLSQACDDAALLAKEAGRPIWVSVNLSAKQLLDTTLVQYFHDEVSRSGLAMGSLKVEVTESVLLGDFNRAQQVLQDLRTMGVQIALDDFGTGYSSLSYLAALPFDLLKVDRSFVTALEPGTQRFDITKAIMQLATTLGKAVVAEGIETATEEHYLVSMGCTLLQGYRIFRPVPLIKAIELITAESEKRSPTLSDNEQAIHSIYALQKLRFSFRVALSSVMESKSLLCLLSQMVVFENQAC
ncbi:MAG: EAL domain-containing protein [Janthinobacterium lividum]